MSHRLVLFVIVALAFATRVWLPYGQVFEAAPGRAVFLEYDAWNHVRITQNLVRHYPKLTGSDPYGSFPDGQKRNKGPAFDLLLGTAAMAAGAGRPSAELIERVAAFVPPVLGAVAVLLVYVVARQVAGRAAGLIAAALLASTPSHFLRVSALGFTDHHVFEVVSWLGAVACLQAAFVSSRYWLWAGGAGVALALNLLTWGGGAVLAAVLVICALPHALRGDANVRRYGICCATAFVCVLPFTGGAVLWSEISALVLLAGVLVALAAEVAARWSGRRRVLFAAAGIAVGVALLPVLVPGWLSEAGANVHRFLPDAERMAILETTPLLLSSGRPSAMPVWDQFRTSALLALAGLGLLAWRGWRERDPGALLMLISGLALCGAALAQSRMLYYAAPLVAAIAGCAAAWALRALAAQGMRAAGPVLVLLLLVPNLAPAAALLKRPGALTPSWTEALEWLRDHSPEPLGDARAWYGQYPMTGFRYPPGAYGVMNWWPEGYWITYIARRIPFSNPTQKHAREAAAFYTSEDPAEAALLLKESGSRYITLDAHLPLRLVDGGKYLEGNIVTMLAWTDKPASRYYGQFLRRQGGRLVPVAVFYPAYFRTAVARLALAHAGTVQAQAGINGIVWDDQTREITAEFIFSNAAEAGYWLRSEQRPAAIVSFDPAQPCVAVEPVPGVRLVHTARGGVKVFEFAGEAAR